MTRTSSGIGSSLLGSTAAAWPVSEMNTSSSVGRCRRCRRSRRRPRRAAAPPRRSCPVCRRTGARHDRRPRTSAARRRARPARRSRARRRPGPRARTSSRSPPIWALSSSDVPSAITLPWSITTIWSASRSASSRYCVVSSTVVPCATRPSIVSQSAEPAARVEPGRRLVEEQHRRAEHERGREVEPAAHAAGVGLRRPLGGLGELEALEQLVRARRARPCGACGRAGRPSRGSRSRSGSRRPPRTGRRARSSRAARRRRASTSSPTTRALPRVGLEQRGQDPHRGGLAGAVRAEQAEHAARAGGEVDAAERAHRAVRLLEPLDDDRIISHALEASEGRCAPMVGFSTPCALGPRTAHGHIGVTEPRS